MTLYLSYCIMTVLDKVSYLLFVTCWRRWDVYGRGVMEVTSIYHLWEPGVERLQYIWVTTTSTHVSSLFVGHHPQHVLMLSFKLNHVVMRYVCISESVWWHVVTVDVNNPSHYFRKQCLSVLIRLLSCSRASKSHPQVLLRQASDLLSYKARTSARDSPLID